MLSEKLQPFLTDGAERGGFVLSDGSVVELDSQSGDDDSFLPSAADILEYAGQAVATWHTHPGASANLSVDDWQTFIDWSNLKHIIIGEDGIRFYRVADGMVLND